MVTVYMINLAIVYMFSTLTIMINHEVIYRSLHYSNK